MERVNSSLICLMIRSNKVWMFSVTWSKIGSVGRTIFELHYKWISMHFAYTK